MHMQTYTNTHANTKNKNSHTRTHIHTHTHTHTNTHTHTHTHVHHTQTTRLPIIHTGAVSSSVQSVLFFLLQEQCITMTRQNEISKVSSSSVLYDRYVYDKICTGIPMSTEARAQMEAAYAWATSHQATHAPTHSLPSPKDPIHPPTLAPSLT